MKTPKIFKTYKDIFLSKRLKKHFVFTVFSFLIFFLLGVLFSLQNKEQARLFLELFAQKYSFALDYGFLQMFLFIFKNNAMIASLAFFSGVIFGLPTFFILFTNSFAIGLVLAAVSSEMSILSIVYSIIPHGIFEIPAILFALTLGFFLGNSFFNFLFKKQNLKRNFLFSFKAFFILVLPLLFLAAIIESSLIVFFK